MELKREVSIITVLLIVLLMAKAAVFPNDTKDTNGDNDLLQRQIKQSKSQIERRYYELCLENDKASLSGSIKAIKAIQGKLLDFGVTNTKNPFGARAIVLAGDISQIYLEDYSKANEYYLQALKIFEGNTEWNISKNYKSYIGIRIGDSLFHQNKYEKATEQWKQTFSQDEYSTFFAQIPGKITLGYKRYLPADKAWESCVQFYDKAIKMTEPEIVRGRFEVERVHVLIEAAERFYIASTRVEKEIEQLIESYPIGKNKFVDMAREMLLHTSNEFRTKYLTAEQLAATSIATETLIAMDKIELSATDCSVDLYGKKISSQTNSNFNDKLNTAHKQYPNAPLQSQSESSVASKNEANDHTWILFYLAVATLLIVFFIYRKHKSITK